MIGIKRLAACTIATICLAVGAVQFAAVAQDAQQSAETAEFVHVKLTEQQIKGFISVQGELAALSKRVEAAGDKPDPKLDAELEALAKKYGFASFEKLDDVAANIFFVLDATDPKTGQYRDPKLDIEAEIKEIEADDKLKADDKKKQIAQLKNDLKSVPTLKHKENVDLVNKHRSAIEKAIK